MTDQLSAVAIQRALRVRHAKDLYIAECKNGPTQSIGARPIRLDGWAFLTTWSPVTSIGYEVKVSRSDFVNDRKWPDYLALCHQFYFVAPKGLIQLAELPEGVGLIEAIGGKGGALVRLVTRRKAIYRQPDAERYLSLVSYVLMCRVRPGGTWVESSPEEIDDAERRRRRIEDWDSWLQSEKDADDIGRRVTKRVGDALHAMDLKVRSAQSKVEFYESTRAALRAIGFDPDVPVYRWGLEKRIEQAIGIVTPELTEAIGGAQSQLARVERELQRLRNLETLAVAQSEGR